MADLWERVKKSASEIYATASEKTVDGVSIGVRKLDVANLRRELSKEFAGLGGRVYQLLDRDQVEAIPEDPTVRHHLERLRDLEARLETKESEIAAIKAGSEDPEEPEEARPEEIPAGPPDSEVR